MVLAHRDDFAGPSDQLHLHSRVLLRDLFNLLGHLADFSLPFLGGGSSFNDGTIVLSHASDEGRFAGGEVAGCEYSRIFSLDR